MGIKPHMVALLALLLVSFLQAPLFAQGLDKEEAIDAIIGSDVKTEEVQSEAAADRVLAAIEKTRENAEKARKTFSLKELDIVFLSNLGQRTGDLEASIIDHAKDIALLREAIEGSALFFHAVDSRSIAVRDVVALEYSNKGTVTIFVNSPPPAN